MKKKVKKLIEFNGERLKKINKTRRKIKELIEFKWKKVKKN